MCLLLSLQGTSSFLGWSVLVQGYWEGQDFTAGLLSLKHNVAAQKTTENELQNITAWKPSQPSLPLGVGIFLLGDYAMLQPEALQPGWFSFPRTSTPVLLTNSRIPLPFLCRADWPGTDRLHPLPPVGMHPCTLLWVRLLGKQHSFRKAKPVFPWYTCLPKQSFYKGVLFFLFLITHEVARSDIS